MRNDRSHFPNFNGKDGQTLAEHLKQAGQAYDNSLDPYAFFHQAREAALPLLPDMQPDEHDEIRGRAGLTLAMDSQQYLKHKSAIDTVLQNNVSNNLSAKEDDGVIITEIAAPEFINSGIVEIDIIAGTDYRIDLSLVAQTIAERLMPKLIDIGLSEFDFREADVVDIKEKIEASRVAHRSITGPGLALNL